MTTRHVALVGTTASGKSALALAVARAHADIELVSVDSMQVYRGMDIGTAKPTKADQAEVRHHLIDLADPDEDFTVARFQQAADAAIADIEARNHRALLVGGTGLYVRALVDGLSIPGRYPEVVDELGGTATTVLHERLAQLDSVAAGRIDPGNRRRIVRALEVTVGSGRPFSSYGPGLESYPPTRFCLLGVALPAEVVGARIVARYEQQLADGFVGEVRGLAARERGMSRTAGQALGYRELLAHVRGECSLDEAVDHAVRRTRQFARRQRSWFRRDPRIEWLTADEDPATVLPSLLRIVGGHT